ncbi:MAG: DegT/DnrJ/EryC1/StrS family aminotransferase, partial [Acidimicrobiia bacterium]
MQEGISGEGSPGFEADGIVIDLRDIDTNLRGEQERIPFLDLATQHKDLKDEILAEWSSILDTAGFIGGQRVDEFEEQLARYVGTSCAVGVANGTDAITLALEGLGLQHGDEVITAANTFFATVEAIVHAGGVPVLVDVDPTTATIDPQAIEDAITPRTRFIIPVHLYGQPADMDAIMAIADHHDLLVVEDNAQAIGAMYRGRRTGSIGHAGAVSFYPGKNLGATGDGGAVTTNSHELARAIRMLANHGSLTKYNHVAVGYNSRLDAIHASALSIKLRHLDEWNAGRQRVAASYAELLDDLAIDLPEVGLDRTHVYHLYVVRHHDRSYLQRSLDSAGISTGLHYPTPIHLTGPFEHLGNGPGSFPVSEDWADRGLSLPMFAGLEQGKIDRIADEIKGFVASNQALTLDTA